MRLLAATILLCTITPLALAQGPRPQLSPEEIKALIEKREAIERQLEDVAIIDRKVMVPMSDGARMAADIYRPKDISKKYPIIFSRTPYNFNFWDVKLGTYRDMSQELDAVKRGVLGELKAFAQAHPPGVREGPEVDGLLHVVAFRRAASRVELVGSSVLRSDQRRSPRGGQQGGATGDAVG